MKTQDYIDTDRRITFWNRAAERISGFPADDVLGTKCADNILRHCDECGKILCEADTCPAWKSIQTGQVVEADVFLHHKNGYRVPVSVRTSALHDAAGKVKGAIEIFRETLPASELERRLKELEALALIDPLTRVGNRRLGDIRLDACMNEFQRYRWPYGVLFADIDRFKEVNDEWGHEAGDRVLTMTAQTMAKNVRSFDHVIRWGGEEFLIVLVNVDETELRLVAEKLRALVERSNIEVRGRQLSVTISMGATLCRADDTKESLVDRADGLMYQSKAAGRNRIVLG
jgi:diguanylate cyclase (GGDEF)-like protein/PAS domain S-box-containing protein